MGAPIRLVPSLLLILLYFTKPCLMTTWQKYTFTFNDTVSCHLFLMAIFITEFYSNHITLVLQIPLHVLILLTLLFQGKVTLQ